jgi:hypothetical protein
MKYLLEYFMCQKVVAFPNQKYWLLGYFHHLFSTFWKANFACVQVFKCQATLQLGELEPLVAIPVSENRIGMRSGFQNQVWNLNRIFSFFKEPEPNWIWYANLLEPDPEFLKKWLEPGAKLTVGLSYWSQVSILGSEQESWNRDFDFLEESNPKTRTGILCFFKKTNQNWNCFNLILRIGTKALHKKSRTKPNNGVL